jgi:hypothetical protein
MLQYMQRIHDHAVVVLNEAIKWCVSFDQRTIRSPFSITLVNTMSKCYALQHNDLEMLDLFRQKKVTKGDIQSLTRDAYQFPCGSS